VEGCFGHSPGSATCAKTSLLAAKGDKTLELAVLAFESEEATSQHPAFKKSFEFRCHMQRKSIALKGAQILKTSEVFLNNFVEQSGFRAAPDVALARPRKGCLA
jgi:hypothetical protein